MGPPQTAAAQGRALSCCRLWRVNKKAYRTQKSSYCYSSTCQALRQIKNNSKLQSIPSGLLGPISYIHEQLSGHIVIIF